MYKNLLFKNFPVIFCLFFTIFTVKQCIAEEIYFAGNLTECFIEAGRYYKVPPLILRAIAYIESNLNPKALNKNKNGTVDIGLMQINSKWLPILKKYGITKKLLLENPCLNIFVGAWILAQCFATYQNIWDAVSCYHTGKKYGTNKNSVLYTWKVYRFIKKLSNL